MYSFPRSLSSAFPDLLYTHIIVWMTIVSMISLSESAACAAGCSHCMRRWLSSSVNSNSHVGELGKSMLLYPPVEFWAFHELLMVYRPPRAAQSRGRWPEIRRGGATLA